MHAQVVVCRYDAANRRSPDATRRDALNYADFLSRLI